MPFRNWFIDTMTAPSVKIRTRGDRVQKPNEKTIEQDASNETIGSKYPSADSRPSEGFVLEIDGQFESEYGSLMGALKAGFELRRRFPHSQVKLHEANERTPVAT
jgi:hypothetical protein